MALKATIFKADLQIADMDRGYYAQHALTLARHPSETDERMMVRLLAFALNASETLLFGRGLGTEDEADIWAKDLTGAIQCWIDVGQPEPRDLRKACGRSAQVILYSFGGRVTDLWWQANADLLRRQNNLAVWKLDNYTGGTLGDLVQRNMALQCTIQDAQAWLTDGTRTVEVTPVRLL